MVPHQGLITVWPKDGNGESRKASFVMSFNEEEIRSANIRYFFPDGCQSPQLEVNSQAVQREVETARQPKEFVPKTKTSRTFNVEEGPVTRGPKPSKNKISKDTLSVQPLKPEIPVEVAEPDTTQKYIEASTARPRSDPITVKPRSDPVIVNPRSRPITVKPKIEAPSTRYLPEPATPYKAPDTNSLCSDTCCDDNRPQILMSKASSGSCCKGVSKIVIPIDSAILEKLSITEISDLNSLTSSVEMLQKLLKFVEKHQI